MGADTGALTGEGAEVGGVEMTLIDVDCLYCGKLLCRMTEESFVQVKCRHCKKMNSVSVAIMINLSKSTSAKLKLLPRAPAQ